MKVDELFGQNLRAMRRKQKLTQADLAKKAGISLPAVQLLESGHRWPEIATVRKLARALGAEEIHLFVPAELKFEVTITACT